MSIFGKMIEEARKQKKLTLRKLGQLVGLAPSFLSEIENGKRLPPKDENKINDLAIVLSVDADNLLRAAREDRVKLKPKLFERLDHDLAWGLCRESEDVSDDTLQKAFAKALEIIRGEKSDK